MESHWGDYQSGLYRVVYNLRDMYLGMDTAGRRRILFYPWLVIDTEERWDQLANHKVCRTIQGGPRN